MNYEVDAENAMKLVSARRYREAIPILRRLLHETYVADFEYDDWLRALAESAQAVSAPMAAGYAYLYLHDFRLALGCFRQASSALDQALCHESQGQHGEAARLFLSEKRLARAAVNLEDGGEHEQAREIWERLRASMDPRHEPYAYALTCLNAIHNLEQLGADEDAVRKGRIEALSLLEDLANEREQAGMLDEALDCYHLMIQIGQRQRSFENLSEGYINAIRILVERGRMLTALRYYAGIGQVGEERGEHHAVATLYREAAEAVHRAGMLYGSFYIRRAGEAWLTVASANVDRGAPAEMTENALLAALDCFNQLNDAQSITRCYQRLARLELEGDKSRRYQSLATQSSQEERTPIEVLEPSEILNRPPRLPPLWREDLLEWEAGDDPVAMLTQVIWDLNYHDTVRRRALNLVLFNLDLQAQGAQSDRRLAIEAARALAHMQPKQAFRGLKRLTTHQDAQVRAEVMRSAGYTAHPSGLVLIEVGLNDGEQAVREAAIESIARHSYSEAFDALKRIFEAHSAEAVQRQVIETMGKIREFEAAEYLYRLLAGGHPQHALRDVRASLEKVLTPDWRRVFRNRARGEAPSVQERLRFLTA